MRIICMLLQIHLNGNTAVNHSIDTNTALDAMSIALILNEHKVHIERKVIKYKHKYIVCHHQ